MSQVVVSHLTCVLGTKLQMSSGHLGLLEEQEVLLTAELFSFQSLDINLESPTPDLPQLLKTKDDTVTFISANPFSFSGQFLLAGQR